MTNPQSAPLLKLRALAQRVPAMQPARRHFFDNPSDPVTVTHADPASPRRGEVESFIRQVFARHHAADVTSFAPNLVLFERRQQFVAACGWRPAGSCFSNAISSSRSSPR